MVRLTPLPLLRDLAPDTLVVRCGLCHELVLGDECCGDIASAPVCPRRAMLESSEGATKLLEGSVRLPALSVQRAVNA